MRKTSRYAPFTHRAGIEPGILSDMRGRSIMQHFKENFLKYTLLPLFVLMVAASYWRFMILHDNLVSYEVACNPTTESCYVRCEDESITDLNVCPSNSLFYYAIIERYAADLIALCGDTVVDCEFADICTETERTCNISYCDKTTDGDICVARVGSKTLEELRASVSNEI